MSLALDQPGVDKLFHVMRDRRLRQSDRLDQIALADGPAVRGHQVHEPHARGIAERLEQLRRGNCLFVGEGGSP